MSAYSFFLSLLAGLVLGLFFYGGLWLTVRSLSVTRYPVWLTLSSFWIRTLLVLASFLFLIQGGWPNALVGLAGFAGGRLAVSGYLKPREARSKCP
jgi:F1F0 ATPase subunit 2